MAARKARILILCKTYPSPSAAHTETSCIAGIEDNGQLIRLYPVPFRMIEEGAQFKKWQWITAWVEKASKDHRPESHRIGVDTIECEEPIVSSRNGWANRREWIDKLPVCRTPDELEQARLKSGITLGLLRPARLLGLDITPTSANWTEEEKNKLLQSQKQGKLFGTGDTTELATLRKIPFDFHYRCAYLSAGGTEVEARHKIVDWEAGALYWNVRKRHIENWQVSFREKYVREFATKDLMFLMGTIHRFPGQWLIVSVIYPPKQRATEGGQLSFL